MTGLLEQIPQSVQNATSTVAGGSTLATILGYLPDVAAILGGVWFLLLITEWIVNKRWRRKDK